jgi:hypothetical protein
MPRPPPLNLINIPKVERQQPLPQKHDYARLLGFRILPDDAKSNLAHIIALMAASKGVVQGHTAQRVAAELERCAKRLRREQKTGRPDMRVRRLLADPRFGLDVDSFNHLQPFTSASTATLLAAVEARQREVAEMSRINPLWGALVLAAGIARELFLHYATGIVRNQPSACWDFILAMLDDAGFPTEALHDHPERLTSRRGPLR